MLKEFRFSANLIGSLLNYRKRELHCRSLPNIVWIEPTNLCNLKCPMCLTSYPGGMEKGVMSMEVFAKAARETAGFALDCYLLLAGEPLLNPQIVPMIKLLKSLNMTVIIDSNGALLSGEKAEGIVDAGLDLISFSFDGYTPEVYENIRVNAKFNDTLNNLLHLLEIKRALRKRHPHVRIKCIENPRRPDKFNAELREAFRRRFNGYEVEFMISTPGDWNGQLPEQDAYQLSQTRPIDPKAPGYHPCPQLWSALTVRWNGQVGSCCGDLRGENLLGDLKEKSLREIWNDAPMITLREKHIKGEIDDLKACRACGYLKSKTVGGIYTVGFSGLTSLPRKVLGIKGYRRLTDWFRRSFKL